jgi:tetratricopeptide (TPR) repeat protein
MAMRKLRVFQVLGALFMSFATSVALSAQATGGNGINGDTAAIESALRSRDYSRALELAQAALKRSPGQVRILTLEGIAYSSGGRTQEALAVFLSVLKIDPNSLAALEGAAQIEFNAGDPGAEKLLHRVLVLRPNDVTSHAMLAVIAYSAKDCAEAIDQFSKAEAVISGNPVALTEYGSCLLNENRNAEAVKVLEQALAIKPDDAGLRYNLGVAQQAAHLSRDAIATLNPLISGEHPDPDALAVAAAAHEDINETPEAVRLLRMALLADPKQVKHYLDFAALALKHDSAKIGVDVINVGMKQLSDSAPLYVARGVLNVQLDDFDAARKDFETAKRLDPAQTGGAIAEGLSEIAQQNPAQALATIEAQLKTHPDDAFLEYLKALALTRSGAAPGSAEFSEARDAARKAVTLDHDFAIAHDLLAQIDLEDGQFQEAEEQSRLAMDENPSDERAIYLLLQVLRKSGSDPHHEVPELSQRVAALLEGKKNQETVEKKYRLYEPGTNDAPSSKQ